MMGLSARLREAAFRHWLGWRTRPGLIRAVLDRMRLERTDNCASLPSCASPPSARVRVAAVQMRLRLIGNATEYAQMIASRARDAAALGAQLIVFPEDSGTHLVGLLPGLDGLPDDVSLSQATGTVAGPSVRPAEILRFIGPAVRTAYMTTFSEVARRLGVYIASGSAMLPDEHGAVRNVGYLFGPDGALLGRQAKCHLLPLEASWGLEAGDDLRVVRTPAGALGFPICMDATYFETSRILAGLGAEVILIPACDVQEDRAVGAARGAAGMVPEPYNEWKALRGLWPRVQESLTYGIHAAMVGRFLGMTITGRSAILAPVELTPDGSGVLAQAASWDQEEIVVADLDYGALHELWRTSDVDEGFNLALYRKHFPGAYAEYLQRHPGGRRFPVPHGTG
jgi:predicted amidohydrolase